MLDHQGRKAFNYDETVQVFGELGRLSEIIDATRFVASAAILYSDEIGWAWNHAVAEHMGYMLQKQDVSTLGRLLKWYVPLYQAKVAVDILDPLRDLSAYPVVFAPNLYLITPEIAEHLKQYVRDGGLLITGPKAALKDRSNVFLTDIPPCEGLDELFGTTVKRSTFSPWMARLRSVQVRLADDAPFAAGQRFGSERLRDDLAPTQAQPLAYYDDGQVAVTLHRYGQGRAMYVGCEPDDAFYQALIRWLIAEGQLEPVLNTEADVEVTLRAGGGHRLIFILNHNPEPAEIQLEKSYHELISDRPVSGTLIVGSQQVCILSEETL